MAMSLSLKRLTVAAMIALIALTLLLWLGGDSQAVTAVTPEQILEDLGSAVGPYAR